MCTMSHTMGLPLTQTSETLGPLCEALGNGSHIVGIVSEEGELLRIVTQGYLIRTLAP